MGDRGDKPKEVKNPSKVTEAFIKIDSFRRYP